MDGAVLVPCLSLARDDPQKDWFTGYYKDFRFVLAGNLEMAVFVGQYLDDVRLAQGRHFHQQENACYGPCDCQPLKYGSVLFEFAHLFTHSCSAGSSACPAP